MSPRGRGRKILGSEAELVELFRSFLGRPGGRFLTPIGDDAAVVRMRQGKDLVLTTDSFVEGVHYRREWGGPRQVGERAMAGALSDIAAMAAEPVAALITLGLPEAPGVVEIEDLYDGLETCAKRYRCRIVGGETVRTGSDAVITITVMGEVEKGKSLTRSGARTGDLIYVSGTLGKREAALRCLESGCGRRKLRERMSGVFFGPRPRIREALYLRDRLDVTAMIDTSDGLSTDLSHLLTESRAGAVIREEELPVSAEACEVSGLLGESVLEYALHGGEDYELLFTVREKIGDSFRKRFFHRFETEITCIGTITGSGCVIEDACGERHTLVPGGFDHLRRRDGS
jgi:thiamine-monophosphate kinase